MKLYLSSYQLGDNPEKLSELFGTNKKVAVICNARDFDSDKKDYQIKQQEQLANLKSIGLESELLDLREYFGQESKLKQKINEFAGVWVRGGNTFVLRVAYKLSGLDEIIRELSTDKEFVYAGFSAGVCVLQKSLKGLDFVDDPKFVKETYNEEIIWQGLGLIDYVFVPHFESDHVESEDANLEVEYYKKNNIKYKTLRDGEIIIEEINL
jgi:dipeptidase E